MRRRGRDGVVVGLGARVVVVEMVERLGLISLCMNMVCVAYGYGFGH